MRKSNELLYGERWQSYSLLLSLVQLEGERLPTNLDLYILSSCYLYTFPVINFGSSKNCLKSARSESLPEDASYSYDR